MVSNPGIYGVQPRRLRADAMDVARLSRDELRRLLLSRYVELPVFILDISIIYHWDDMYMSATPHAGTKCIGIAC